MKKIIISLSIIFSVFFFSGLGFRPSSPGHPLSSQTAYAINDPEGAGGTDTVDNTTPGITDGIGTKRDWSALNTLAMNIYRILLAVFSSVAVLMIIWGGVTYITSNGNPDKTERAKKIITYAIIGIVVVTSTWLLIKLTASLIGATG